MNFNTGGRGQLSSGDLRGDLLFGDEDAVHAAMTDPHQFRIDLNRILRLEGDYRSIDHVRNHRSADRIFLDFDRVQ